MAEPEKSDTPPAEKARFLSKIESQAQAAQLLFLPKKRFPVPDETRSFDEEEGEE